MNSFTKEDWELLNTMVSASEFKGMWFSLCNDKEMIYSFARTIQTIIKNTDTKNEYYYKMYYWAIFELPIELVPLHIHEPEFTGFLIKWRLRVGK